ncbi:MAG TPA: hypothetical protein VHO93_16505 [Actinomycetota bacterium]|jgi:hypothetical protein|nr:hypothetical protein [Actinomycetota bacterium]
MTWEDMNREMSYQRIAELHADAERFRQVQVSKRRRRREGRGRLGRLLGPTRVASWANDMLGGIISPPWPSRRDTMGPTRLYRPSLGR